ncbi:hypothetical protein SAMN06269185_3343 [Natronoarchaeum philippinense]|uniref:Uncharacterized protein n=1 Tax=Natronoarchaeum philippinense TaxID=558529 RepID=A0A285PDZ7_NATPI|nr:hypothetical protein [Natronoarchaeum philippinense]SNZ18356.1 hypothetical protein SAMN06269185_3343 [Natronoarchaeum philippinense]
MAEPRVTARIHRDADGDLHREYLVGGIAYASIEDVEQVLETA